MIRRIVLSAVIMIALAQCDSGSKRTFFVTKKGEKAVCKGELKEGLRYKKWDYYFHDCNQKIQWEVERNGELSFYVPGDWEHLTVESTEIMSIGGKYCEDRTQMKLVEVPFTGDISNTDFTSVLSEHLSEILTELYGGSKVVESFFPNKQSLFRHSKITIDGEEANAMHLYFTRENKVLCLTQFFKGEEYQMHKYMMFDFLIGLKSKGKELFSIQEAFDYVQPDFDEYETTNEVSLSE